MRQFLGRADLYRQDTFRQPSDTSKTSQSCQRKIVQESIYDPIYKQELKHIETKNHKSNNPGNPFIPACSCPAVT